LKRELIIQAVTWNNPQDRRAMIPLSQFDEWEPVKARVDLVFDNIKGEILVYRNEGSGPRLDRTRRPETGQFGRFVDHEHFRHTHSTSVDELHSQSFVTAYTRGVLVCEDGLYLIDDRDEVVTLLASFEDGTSVGRLLDMTGGQDQALAQSVRLDEEVLMINVESQGPVASIDQDSITVTRVRYPAALREFKSFLMTRSPKADDEFIAIADLQSNPFGLTDVPVFRFAMDGVVREKTVYREFVGMEPEAGSSPSVAAFVPPVCFGFAIAVDALFFSSERTLARQILAAVRTRPTHLVWAILHALLGICVAFFAARHREIGIRRMVWWCIAGGLFGPVGALAILSVYPRINRQPCAACGKNTRVDQAVCNHCGIEEGELPRRGIEIFDGEEKRLSEVSRRV